MLDGSEFEVNFYDQNLEDQALLVQPRQVKRVRFRVLPILELFVSKQI